MLTEVLLYTDGACSYNPGPGGWGVVLISGDNYKEMSGFVADTTNNRMELLAVIKGFKALKRKCRVTVFSDSAYVVNAFIKGWIDGWLLNGFKKSKNKSVANADLWQELYDLTKKHISSFVKVKGHSDNEFNNRCDELATSAIKNNINGQ